MTTSAILGLLLLAPAAHAAPATPAAPAAAPAACKPYAGVPAPSAPAVDPEPPRPLQSNEDAAKQRRADLTEALQEAIRAPGDVAGRVVDALVGTGAAPDEDRGVAPAWRATLALYCAHDRHEEGTTGCEGASVVVQPSGSLEYRSGRAASFCLAPTAPGDGPGWGFRTIAVVRRGAEHGGEASCFDVVPERTYPLPRGDDEATDPVAALSLWSERSAESLKDLREAAAKDAAAAYRRRVQRAFVLRWIGEQPRDAIDDVACYGSALVRASPTPQASDAFVAARKRWAGALTATANAWKQMAPAKGAAVAAEFAKAVDDAAAEIAAMGPDAPWAVGSQGAHYAEYLDAFRRQGGCELAARSPWCELVDRADREENKDLAAASRVAVAFQRADRQVLPFLAFAGEVPGGARGVTVVPVRSGEGERELDVLPRGGSRVSAFVTDLRRGLDTPALLKGDPVETRPSDVAMVVAAAFRVGAIALGFQAPAATTKILAAPARDVLGEACQRRGPGAKRDGECACCAPLQARAEWAVVCASKTGAKPPPGAAWLAAERLARRLRTEPAEAELLPGEDPKALADAIAELGGELGAKWPVPIVAKLRAPSASDAPVDPRRPYTSAVLGAKVEAAHHYRIKVCAAEEGAKAPPKECKADTAERVTADGRFDTAERHRIVSVALELAWSWPDRERISLGGYRYEPRAGTGGPDQLYVLAKSDGTKDRFTVSPVLVAYPLFWIASPWAQGVGIGVGPTLFQGSQAAFLDQWNFRAMYELGFKQTRGVLVSAGVSLRSISVPRDPLGTVVSLPRSDPAPSPETRTRQALVYGVGLALDLSLLGDAASALTGSFTKKEGN